LHFLTINEIAIDAFAGLAKHGHSPVLNADEVESRSLRGTELLDLQLLPYTAVRDYQIDRSLLETVHVRSYEKVERYLLRPGDVVLTSRGTVIRTAIVPPDISRVALGPNLIAIRASATVLPEVLCAYLGHQRGHQAILQEAASTSPTMLNISASALKRVKVPMPPMRVQQKVAELFEVTIRYHAASKDLADRALTAAHDAIVRQLHS